MSGRRSKQRRTTRLVAVGAMVATTFVPRAGLAQDVPATPGDAAPATTLPVRRFDIAAGPLESGLRAFEAASGYRLRVQVPAAILGELTTRGVTGVMTDAQALAQLIDGTGVSHRITGRRAAVVEILSVVIDVSAPQRAVSSPKYTQPLRDTPQTITVVPSEVIEAQGATTLRDILRNTPGITFQAGEGGGGLPGDTFSLRGFSAGNDVTIDGVRDTGAYSREAFNIEQVEVVKGPSGVTAGRGATGGSINLVTKAPKPEAFRRSSIAAGNDEQGRGTIDLNEAVGPAHLRVNALWSHSGVPGRDIVENNAWGIAPSLAFGLGTPTTFTLASAHVRHDNVPDYGLPWAAFDTNVDQSNFYGLRDYDYENVSHDSGSAIFERVLGDDTRLRSVARYSENHRDSAITAPRPPNRQLQQRTMDSSQLASQTSVTTSFATGTVRHDLVAGLELSHETTASRSRAQATNQPQTNLENPDPFQSPLGPLPDNTGNPGETALDVAGLYVFDTIHLGERWQLSGGARFDHIDVDYQLTDLATNNTTRVGKIDDMVSWRAGAIFKPQDETSLYAAFGTSFNPAVDAGAVGPALGTTPTTANDPRLAPERSRTAEVGVKWEPLEGRLGVTGALFRTEKLNARTRTTTSDPFVLAGEQRVDGLEVGITAAAGSWSALAGYALLRTEIEQSANPDEEGAALAFTPEHSFNAWLTRELPGRITVGGGAQYVDGVFRNNTNTARVPSYWLFNAMTSYEVNDALTLRLNVQNLADAEYVDRVGGGHYIPGPRRSVVLSADFDF